MLLRSKQGNLLGFIEFIIHVRLGQNNTWYVLDNNYSDGVLARYGITIVFIISTQEE